MHSDDFEEEWVAEAQVSAESAAAAEFKRLKERLQGKMAPTPLPAVRNRSWGILGRIVGYFKLILKGFL